MGASNSAPQDAIDLSCLPEEFVEGLHSVAEVKKHMQDGNELPQASGSKITVFIDVDETVVYVTPIPLLKVPADRTFAFSEPTGEDKDLRAYTATPLPPLTLEEAAAAAQNFDPNSPQAILYVYYRPFVKRFLTELRSTGNFEIIAFTAALPEYANPILDTLEEEEKLFDHRLYRRHCCRAPRTRSPRVDFPSGADSQWSFTGEVFYYVKDLAHAAPNRDMRRCVLLDNSPVSFAAQMENGIYLRPFCGDPGDDELQFLANMLCQLHKLEDVRAGLHTGLINAAWRSLVERDELYDIAGIPRPPAPRSHTSVGDLLTSPEAFKQEKPRDLLQEAREMRYDLSETASQPVSGELPWIDDSPNSVEESPEKDDREDDIIAAVAASRESNGQQFDERALRTGSSLSLWRASSSDPCAAPGGKDPLSRLGGRRSASQVSVQPCRVSRRTPAKQATPGPASATLSNRQSAQVAPKKKPGPRTPRSAGPREEQNPSHYITCFEAGRARKEAADTRSVVNNCRSSNGYHGESRRSLASSSDSIVPRRVDESSHTIACLKRQERDGTTWCTCAGNKSSAARTFNPGGSKRHVAREPSPRNAGESLSRRASERRLLLRKARDSSEDATSDLASVGSPSYQALPSRTSRGSRVPRLQLQGVARAAPGEETTEFSSEGGLGEEPLTPGKQPLTPSSRKARLASIEQLLEDSVALSRQQCPEPVAQSRNRLKQPATLYGCPDIQAPSLICGMQQSPFGSGTQGRPRSRPLATLGRGGHGDVSLRGLTRSLHGNPREPLACADGSPHSTQPYTSPQYPGFPMQDVQQQRQPAPAAPWEERTAAPPNAPTPQGWAAATPRFADSGSTADMSAAGFGPYSNAAYRKGSGQTVRSPSGFMGGVNAVSSHPQHSPYMPTPRCATPAKDYASMRQQLAGHAHPWSSSPGSSAGFGSWTPRMMRGQPFHNQVASVTTQPPFRQGALPPSMASARVLPQPPKLFAGRRVRLGDLFGGCAESSVLEASPQRMQTPQGNQDLHVRPAVLVKTEESATFGKPCSPHHSQSSLQPSNSRPLIVPYVAGAMPHTPRGPSSVHPAGAPSFVGSPRTCAGGIARGSLPPTMTGGGASTHPGHPHPRQHGTPHFGFPSWPSWPHQATATPLSASMSVLPRFP
ncbi:hypothetical protein ACSSS7_002327 [Eimeria intestinalis]